MLEKDELRTELRARRNAFAATIPASARALILNRPPQAIADYLGDCATIGVYIPVAGEAPSLGWARWLHENGHAIAAPYFTGRGDPMAFRLWENPWDEETLERGPWRIAQPAANAPAARPDALIVPLLGFTADGARLGQGGGHYDRWLGDNAQVKTVGLAWDAQLLDSIPLEPHDRRLDAVVTPTRIHWSTP